MLITFESTPVNVTRSDVSKPKSTEPEGFRLLYNFYDRAAVTPTPPQPTGLPNGCITITGPSDTAQPVSDLRLETHGVVESPNFPRSYPSYVRCMWRLEVCIHTHVTIKHLLKITFLLSWGLNSRCQMRLGLLLLPSISTWPTFDSQQPTAQTFCFFALLKIALSKYTTVVQGVYVVYGWITTLYVIAYLLTSVFVIASPLLYGLLFTKSM